MRTLALLVTASLLTPLVRAQSWPDGYWERQYGFGQQWSAMYTVTVKVKSLSTASEKASKILEQAGGRPQNGFGGFPQAQSVRMNYLVPVDAADKAAKRLFELGDLQQFANQRLPSASQLPEVREKIAAIEAEQRANAAALENMPVARTLLTTQLTKLAQTRASLEASAGTAVLNLTLVDAAAPDAAFNAPGFPRHGPMLAEDGDGSAKASLGAIRSALSIYFGANDGRYPAKLSDLAAGGRYLAAVPRIRVAGHPETDAAATVSGVDDMDALKKKLKDTGGWAYVGDPKSKIFGTVVIDCTHVDARGTAWDGY